MQIEFLFKDEVMIFIVCLDYTDANVALTRKGRLNISSQYSIGIVILEGRDQIQICI